MAFRSWRAPQFARAATLPPDCRGEQAYAHPPRSSVIISVVMHSAHLKAIEDKIQQLSEDEMLQLAASLTQAARARAGDRKRIDWSKFKGVLKADIDSLDYQRQIREEWD